MAAVTKRIPVSQGGRAEPRDARGGAVKEQSPGGGGGGEASCQPVFPFPRQPHTWPPAHLHANANSHRNLILTVIQPRVPTEPSFEAASTANSLSACSAEVIDRCRSDKGARKPHLDPYP